MMSPALQSGSMGREDMSASLSGRGGRIQSYKNQVGGHVCLLTRETSLGEVQVLKPAIDREERSDNTAAKRNREQECAGSILFAARKVSATAAPLHRRIPRNRNTGTRLATGFHRDGQSNAHVQQALCAGSEDGNSPTWA